MNILTDPLPTTITVQDTEIPIKTDFRVWIQFIGIVQEYDLEHLTVEDYIDMTERISRILFTRQPELSAELFPAIVAFFCGFSDTKKGDADRERTYDYSIDADAIYSSFAQAYGIRLDRTQMHWYEFRALFANMPEDCAIGRLIRIRSMKDSDVPREKRQDLHKLKESVALPAFRSYKEDNEALTNLRKALK